jgi:hypothetical protein
MKVSPREMGLEQLGQIHYGCSMAAPRWREAITRPGALSRAFSLVIDRDARDFRKRSRAGPQREDQSSTSRWITRLPQGGSISEGLARRPAA